MGPEKHIFAAALPLRRNPFFGRRRALGENGLQKISSLTFPPLAGFLGVPPTHAFWDLAGVSD